MSCSFDKTDSGTWIEVSGLVVGLLQDDSEGARHQRIILGISRKQTLLIAHNVEMAGRVPVGMGDRIHVRGVYEWNDLGGLVHWTHRDPHSTDEGGYIRYRSKTYR
jgi:hypothetical protein